MKHEKKTIFLHFFRLEPLNGLITSVSELMPEEHRTSRGQVQPRDDTVMMDESRVNKRVKTTIEDWENEQVGPFQVAEFLK